MPTLSILYVEDNESLRETISMLLEGGGREVVSCANGEQALEAWSRREFDVVMTDVNLPGISGTDLARRLVAIRPQVWIVLCSGLDVTERSRQLGTNVRVLRKPFEYDELDSVIAAAEAARTG